MPRKRQTGDGALYQDKRRNLWKAVIDLDPWPDGRRHQLTATSRTAQGARDKIAAKRKEIAEFGAPLDRTATVREWADVWLTTVCRPKLKPNALAAYESVTRSWIVPTIGNKVVASLKPSDIRLVHKAIADAKLSSSTARKAYNIMSGMFEAARKDGLSARNVVADVDAPPMAVSDRGALTTDQALSILQVSAGLVDGTKWWTALLGGLRQSERSGALLSSLNLDTEMLTVEWALEEIASEHGCGESVDGKWPCGKTRGGSCSHREFKMPDGFEYKHLSGRLFLVRPKSGKARQVPLVPALAEALRRYVIATAEWPNPYNLIWRHPDGSPILPREDEQAWRDILHAAEIITAEQTKTPKERKEGTPDVPTSHWARHTTATVLMELGVDAKIIGEIVGHGDVKVTRGYQHVSTPAAIEAMGRLGAHFAAGLTAPVRGES